MKPVTDDTATNHTEMCSEYNDISEIDEHPNFYSNNDDNNIEELRNSFNKLQAKFVKVMKEKADLEDRYHLVS